MFLWVFFFFVSYMIFYMFQCHSPQSSHPFNTLIQVKNLWQYLTQGKHFEIYCYLSLLLLYYCCCYLVTCFCTVYGSIYMNNLFVNLVYFPVGLLVFFTLIFSHFLWLSKLVLCYFGLIFSWAGHIYWTMLIIFSCTDVFKILNR